MKAKAEKKPDEQSKSGTVVTLRKPVAIGEGEAKRTISEIDLKGLDELTGADINFCMREASSAKGELVRVMVLDIDLHIEVASRATGLPVEVFNMLHARDYAEVATLVQNFLTGSA